MTPADREKLVEAYGQACYDEGIAVARRDSQRHREAIARELNARAALLALYAEPVGEVVETHSVTTLQSDSPVTVIFPGKGFSPGTRVRVVRIDP